MAEKNLHRLPILALRKALILPTESLPVAVGRPRSSALVAHLGKQKSGEPFVALAQKVENQNDPMTLEDFYEYGTVATSLKVVAMKGENGADYTLFLRGESRMRLHSLEEPEGEDGVLYGEFEVLPNVWSLTGEETPEERQEAISGLRRLAQRVAREHVQAPVQMEEMVGQYTEPGALADFLATHLVADLEERLEYLKMYEVSARVSYISEALEKRLEEFQVQVEIQEAVQSETNNTQREYYLRQQLKAIRSQLGEEDDILEELEERVAATPFPEDAEKVVRKQLKRLSTMQPSSSEYSVTLGYVEQMLDVPWGILTEDNLDLERAQEVLDEDHYGLDKVKDRVIEYLAVRSLKEDMQGPILCLNGPPGVGKTSIAKSIARTMGRKFERISLGGVQDESEIRGHRRTYVGALPGRLVRALQTTGTENPVILLDEIDKVGSDFRGDPSAALLEVLDPAQNNAFKDHYLDVDVDLSKVLFIATANRLDTISPPLRDRMEILDVPSYTLYEKVQIGQLYLLPKQMEAHGLSPEHIEMDEEVLHYLVDKYTREAGVRNLNRRLADLCRYVAVQVAKRSPEARADFQLKFTQEEVAQALGPIRHMSEVAQREDQVGVATGLAWTQVGGDILFIETQAMKGKGEVTLTGQLGDVMKESVRAALSYIRANAEHYQVENIKEHDLHVHVPAGAIPKDGPSAGITMFTAILSALTGVPVRHNVAMTGEITLTGQILPVGGIKEKVIAAHRAGIRTVVMPAVCKKDLVDVEATVIEDMTFHYVKQVSELPDLVFASNPWGAPESVSTDAVPKAQA